MSAASALCMPEINGVILQSFHSYLATDVHFWLEVKRQSEALAAAGFTAIWLPPLAQTPLASISPEQTSPEPTGCSPAADTARSQAIASLQAARLLVYGDRDLPADPHSRRPLEAEQWDGLNLNLKSNSMAALAQWLGDWRSHWREPGCDPRFAMFNLPTDDVQVLHHYLSLSHGAISALDWPLHANFHRASRSGGYFDMQKILDRSLMQQQPALAVTFVDNHQSQPLQRQESVVEPWFKPLAYALILLRREGYPCLFSADYDGAHYRDRGYEIRLNSHQWLLDKFLFARRNFAYGPQRDYFDNPDAIGWTRWGNAEHPGSLAVLLSDGWGGSKWMETSRPNAVYYDLTEHLSDPVYTNEFGWGEFYCKGNSVSVWLEQQAVRQWLRSSPTQPKPGSDRLGEQFLQQVMD